MLEPLKQCTNPEHEIEIFNLLIIWQIANDIWCTTQKNGHRHSHYFSFYKVQSEKYDSVVYNLVIWKLSIKFGFYK